jgi:hypothetical protein
MAGIALVRRSDSQTTYFSENRVALPDAVASPSERSVSEQVPTLDQLPHQLAATLPSLQDLGTLVGDGTAPPSALGLTKGAKPSGVMAGGGATTQVFGAQATGSKFVYVFDRSASMEGFRGRPMQAAKAELSASLGHLESVHQFQIIFYNERIAVFNPFHPSPPRMMFASDANRALAEEFVRSIVPAGGTRHAEAIRTAIGLRPDAIFLLTDAEFPRLSPSELAEIRRLNRAGASIHTIEFGSGPFPGGDNFLVRLARENAGQHVYVDISRLAGKE